MKAKPPLEMSLDKELGTVEVLLGYSVWEIDIEVVKSVAINILLDIQKYEYEGEGHR